MPPTWPCRDNSPIGRSPSARQSDWRMAHWMESGGRVGGGVRALRGAAAGGVAAPREVTEERLIVGKVRARGARAGIERPPRKGGDAVVVEGDSSWRKSRAPFRRRSASPERPRGEWVGSTGTWGLRTGGLRTIVWARSTCPSSRCRRRSLLGRVKGGRVAGCAHEQTIGARLAREKKWQEPCLGTCSCFLPVTRPGGGGMNGTSFGHLKTHNK